MTDIDDAWQLTAREVRDAMVRILPQEFEDMDDTAALVIANDVLRNVRVYREREWHVADVVVDNAGKIWQRMNSCQWRKMASPGVFSHSRPERPLTLIHSPYDEAEQRKRLAGLERARDDGAPI